MERNGCRTHALLFAEAELALGDPVLVAARSLIAVAFFVAAAVVIIVVVAVVIVVVAGHGVAGSALYSASSRWTHAGPFLRPGLVPVLFSSSRICHHHLCHRPLVSIAPAALSPIFSQPTHVLVLHRRALRFVHIQPMRGVGSETSGVERQKRQMVTCAFQIELSFETHVALKIYRNNVSFIIRLQEQALTGYESGARIGH